MSNFVPGPACGALQAYIYQPDPRYQIRPEWVVCRDGVRRARYRAFYNGCTIGEIAPSYRRETVIAELQELIAAGGVGTMADLPGREAASDA